MHPGALGERDLRAQMGAAAEPVQPEPPARRQRAPAQRAVTDDARAEQRSQGDVVDVVEGESVGERGRDGRVLGVAAVRVPAGVLGGRAEVLRPAPAVDTGTVRATQPGHTHPVTEGETAHGRSGPGHHAHHLVPGRHPGPVHRQIPLGDMQIGPAHPARAHTHEEFVGAGHRDRLLDQPQRPFPGPHRAGPVHHPRTHRPVGHAFQSVTARAARRAPRPKPD